MTPQERLAEIEHNYKTDPESITWYEEDRSTSDASWLISRVKKLTKALEIIKNGGISPDSPAIHIGMRVLAMTECAAEALQGEDK